MPEPTPDADSLTGKEKMTIFLIIAAVLVAAYFYFNAGAGDRPVVFIEGPSRGVPGQPVEFTVRADNADDVQLIALPAGTYCTETGPNKFVLMDPRSTMFTLIAAAADGGRVGVVTFEYSQTGEPTPPGPDPGPDPDPGPLPPEPYARLSAVAKQAVEQYQPSNSQEAKALANAFDKAASEGHLMEDPSDFRALVREYSHEAIPGASLDHWQDVDRAVEREIEHMTDEGTLRTSNDYAKAWQAVAKGFREAVR